YTSRRAVLPAASLCHFVETLDLAGYIGHYSYRTSHHFFVLFLFRRQKSSNKNGACKDKNSKGLHNTSSRLIASAKLSISSSPDVKGECLQGGNLSRSPAAPKFKGVQVFTYKEIEMATNRFNEANVIDNGGFDLMYRGVLSDGTLAAIKLLHREGKQGERAFKVDQLHHENLVKLIGYCLEAKKFGINEFVNPKDHNKPIQEIIAEMTNGEFCSNPATFIPWIPFA
ncbi:hypothetical protein S83_016022, partial [Arachis hypogaea]